MIISDPASVSEFPGPLSLRVNPPGPSRPLMEVGPGGTRDRAARGVDVHPSHHDDSEDKPDRQPQPPG
eukprot:777468-Rhodomonas_salina.1